MADAYLLVSHGSRDPRPQIAVTQLAQQLSVGLSKSTAAEFSTLVATAQLELADKPLHVQIIDFANNCAERGITRVVILPLFLISGVHAIEDIPTEVAIAALEIGDLVKLLIAPFLGSHPEFAKLFAQNRYSFPSQSILLAHGSRRSGGNAIVEQLASNLDLKIAYWSIGPSLTDLVAELVATDTTEIGILAYFLFVGGITDAISESVTQLKQQYPQVQLILGEPIGNSLELVTTIGKILKSIEI